MAVADEDAFSFQSNYKEEGGMRLYFYLLLVLAEKLFIALLICQSERHPRGK